MTSPIFGEFIGTMVLIVLGDGVVAGVLLKRSKAEGSGWMAITTGWFLAVVGGVFAAVACGSKDAFINPAFTLGMAIVSGSYSKVLPYAGAQLAGAFVGAILVWVHYLPHWRETPDASFKLGVFCTGPAIRSFGANLISEIIGTFFLVFVTAAIFSKTVSKDGVAAGLGPYLAGVVVWAIGLSLGGTTGYAINPARDLGPRIAHAVLPIAGKGSSDWGYAGIPVVGPVIGASLAGLVVRLLQF
jgi:glycerol uptake facilitator protein